MSNVVIVTDSVTNLPQEYLDKFPIRVVPASLIWSGEILRDGVDIQPVNPLGAKKPFHQVIFAAQNAPANQDDGDANN